MKNIIRFIRCGGLLFVALCLFTGTNPLLAQWVQTNGLYGGTITCFAVSPNGAGGTNLFAGTDDGSTYFSTNNGTSWTAANTLFSNFRGLVTNGTYLFAGAHGGVFRSTDNGTSWDSVNTGLPTGTNVTALAVSPNGAGDTNLFVAVITVPNNVGHVFLSTNNGASWSAASTGLPTYTYFMDLAVSPNGAGGTNLFVNSETLGHDGHVFLSTNNGASWSAASTGLPTNTYFADLAVSPNGAGGTNLFAASYGGVFLSTNNGTSWTAAGLTNTDVSSFAVSPNGTGGTSLFAGTGSGVFLSTNNGTSWSAVNTGLSDTTVLALAVSPNGAGGTNLFAGTLGGGVWRRPLSEMITSTSVENPSIDLPTHFSLDQNYPNPFNPATTISFILPSKSFISLKIFDALGREVSVLVSEELPAGTYTRQWNASALSSGVYFYKLASGSNSTIKKMMLLK